MAKDIVSERIDYNVHAISDNGFFHPWCKPIMGRIKDNRENSKIIRWLTKGEL